MWFTETPWPPILICGLAAVACLIQWQQRQQMKYFGGALACIVVAVGVYFLEQQIVTEKEQVELAVVDITSAFQRRDLEATLSHVSNQAPVVKSVIVFGYNILSVEDDMRLTDVSVDLIAQNTRAISKFRINGTVKFNNAPSGDHMPSRWEAKWQLEDGEWRMIEIQELDPLTGEPIDRLGALRGQIPNVFGG